MRTTRLEWKPSRQIGTDYYNANTILGNVGKLYARWPWEYQIRGTELAKIRERLRLPVSIEILGLKLLHVHINLGLPWLSETINRLSFS